MGKKRQEYLPLLGPFPKFLQQLEKNQAKAWGLHADAGTRDLSLPLLPPSLNIIKKLHQKPRSQVCTMPTMEPEA